MDFIGRQNAIDVSPGVSFSPMDKMTFSATGHLFWRAESTDALYNAGGGVVRAGSAGVDDEIGSEIDLTMKYKFDVRDKVRIRGTEGKGEVLDRRFALVSLMHMSLLPTKYYTVMIQNEYDLGEGPKTMNWVRVEFPLRDLESFTSIN